MLHDNRPVMADNGLQYFLPCQVEEILQDAYDYDYSSGSRRRRYSDREICEAYGISQTELDRMRYRLSSEYCLRRNKSYQ